ncbi:MAG: LicD family protein, partial [Eubacterium sp.]|nr:LicD family protein [Eubacterium sp.]
LDCVATNPKHWSIISNVQLVRKTKFEKKENYKNNALNCGPCIDVFPLDYIPKANGLKLKIRGKFIRILRRTLWIKSGIHNRSSYTTVWKRIFYYCSGKIISFLFSIKGLHNKLNKLMLKTNDENNKYLINFGSLYDFSKEIYDKDLFGTPIEMEFEGHKFYVPSKPTKILETLYDDYTVLPPVEKRRSMHHFKNFE